ncbi:MAG: YcxB family protein [Methylacidiphilales bacterium]|nr:YcxB family protein [Candidatus Methylacidiphilales bacterium]
MKICYNLTRLDLLHARVVRLLANRPQIVLLLAISGFFLITAFTQEANASKDVTYKIIYAGIEIVFVVGAGLVGGVLMIVAQCLTTKGKGVLGKHTLEVTDEGLVETTEYNTSIHRWPAFHKVTKSRGFLWIFVTDSLIHIVPLKRPLLEGNLADFVEQIKRRTESA